MGNSTDFGTCTTRSAWLAGQELRRVRNPQNSREFSVPSNAYITSKNEILVGTAANRNRRSDPSRFRAEFKRDLGQRHPYRIGDLEVMPQQLVSLLLGLLKQETELAVGTAITETVLTVPASYDDYRMLLMRQAAADAGYQQVTLLPEPEAALLYYAYTQRLKPVHPLKEGDIVMVFDLGGGTFDVALLQLRNSRYIPLVESAGEPMCGGIDFDRAIFQDVCRKSGPQLRAMLDSQDMDALRARILLGEQCREIKERLSTEETVTEPLIISNGASIDYTVTRAEFEQMITPYLQQTLPHCTDLVRGAGLEWKQVSGILLVGGSCRIPYVSRLLQQQFARPLLRTDDPELAVCLGAAVYNMPTVAPRPETSVFPPPIIERKERTRPTPQPQQKPIVATTPKAGEAHPTREVQPPPKPNPVALPTSTPYTIHDDPFDAFEEKTKP